VEQNSPLRLHIPENRRRCSQSMYFSPLVPDERNSGPLLPALSVHRNHVYEKVEGEFVDTQAPQTAEGDVCWFFDATATVGDSLRGGIDIARLVSRVCESVGPHQIEKSYSQHYVIREQQLKISIVAQIFYQPTYKLRVRLIFFYFVSNVFTWMMNPVRVMFLARTNMQKMVHRKSGA